MGIILLFFVSALAPMTFGVDIDSKEESVDENFDRELYSEYYTAYNIEEIPENIRPFISNNNEVIQDISTTKVINYEETPKPLDGPMDSAWPMYKYDSRNTGRCEYDTSNNVGGELWKYFYEYISAHSMVIDKDGILYVPTWYALHSVYPDGTKRYTIDHGDIFTYTPALGEDGTIYFGTTKQFFACYPNGTIKWTLDKVKDFYGYPTIGSDGTIYAGTDDGYLYAINPNGTIRWEYYVGYNWIFHPAVDNQGNIYFTTYYSTGALYCLNPNGTFKWKYTKNLGFSCGPVIGDDGMIYVVPSSDLVAVNPDGTVKWDVYMHDWFGHPSLAHDGTIIIAGGGDDYVTAVDPADGSIIWQYRVSNSINFISTSDVAIGGDGTIYFAYVYNDYIGYMCALSSDGVLKWETHLTSDVQPYDDCGIYSEPCISSDGTVYINTVFRGSGSYGGGYLHAIGMQNPIDAPEAPIITGETNGRPGRIYEYTLQATSPTGDDVYYFVDWDDYFFEEWFGPYPSGVEVTLSHIWWVRGTYNIGVKAKTADGLCSQSELRVNMGSIRATNEMLLLRLLELFPNAFLLLRNILRHLIF